MAGLRAAGYQVAAGRPWGKVAPGDVLVTWNRYAEVEAIADGFEAAGGTVLVAENGYCGRDAAGRQYYALAIGGHNGSGRWPSGGPERWKALGLELGLWRDRGDHILVCPNRSFGRRDMIMPADWAANVVKRLRRHTSRPIRVRPHPGNWQETPPKIPLAADLENAHACVIWSSSCGVHALLAGVPVFFECPHWILAGAGERDIRNIEEPAFRDRGDPFVRLAWAQWSVDEIASGRPFIELRAACTRTAAATCTA